MNITKDQIESVKQSNEIVSYIGSRFSLKKKGSSYVSLCPFHTEKTPSFTVNPKTQRYKCFGCGETGDVIGFVVKHDNLSFKEAMKRLSGDRVQGSGKTKRQQSGGRSQKPEEKRKPEEPLTPSQQKLLNRVMEYYQQTLYQDTRGLEYLEQRGIKERQSIADFGAGFASGNLLETISSSGELTENLKTLGILNKKGHEFFYGCVVFPLLDQNGNVISAYGRRIKEGEVTHLYLPLPKKGIVNRQAAKRSKTLILTESIIDALSLYNAGFKNVIPCYGTNGMTQDHLSLLAHYQTAEIYICFDTDQSGIQAGQKISVQLSDQGIKTCLISLPEKDLNDYFKRHTPEEFEKLLKTVNPETLVRSDLVSKREENLCKETKNGLIVGFGQRRYQIKGISSQGTQYRVTIKAYRADTGEADPKFELTTIDMYSLRSRTWFAAMCSGLLGETEELILEDLNRLLEKIENRDTHDTEKKEKK